MICICSTLSFNVKKSQKNKKKPNQTYIFDIARSMKFERNVKVKRASNGKVQVIERNRTEWHEKAFTI